MKRTIRNLLFALVALLLMNSMLSQALKMKGCNNGCKPEEWSWGEHIIRPPDGERQKCITTYNDCPDGWLPGLCAVPSDDKLSLDNNASSCVQCVVSDTDQAPHPDLILGCNQYDLNQTFPELITTGSVNPGVCEQTMRPFTQSGDCSSALTFPNGLGDTSTKAPLSAFECTASEPCSQRHFQAWDRYLTASGGQPCEGHSYIWEPQLLSQTWYGAWTIDPYGHLRGPPTWNPWGSWQFDLTVRDCSVPPQEITYRAYFRTGL